MNQHLNSLMSSDISFPMSINLAVGSGGSVGVSKEQKDMEKQISRLKDQNRFVELGGKSYNLHLLILECSQMKSAKNANQ